MDRTRRSYNNGWYFDIYSAPEIDALIGFHGAFVDANLIIVIIYKPPGCLLSIR